MTLVWRARNDSVYCRQLWVCFCVHPPRSACPLAHVSYMHTMFFPAHNVPLYFLTNLCCIALFLLRTSEHTFCPVHICTSTRFALFSSWNLWGGGALCAATSLHILPPYTWCPPSKWYSQNPRFHACKSGKVTITRLCVCQPSDKPSQTKLD